MSFCDNNIAVCLLFVAV